MSSQLKDTAIDTYSTSALILFSLPSGKHTAPEFSDQLITHLNATIDLAITTQAMRRYIIQNRTARNIYKVSTWNRHFFDLKVPSTYTMQRRISKLQRNWHYIFRGQLHLFRTFASSLK
ncbi:hypothetical protein APHCRT_1250 [Anaplasma phagocytophilum str. CRT53-1]|uniref:Uncharacterized protein n=1 Tax=Anaplasma phagocytophilum str. CRT53-1 TaxID=1359157 RepID=A0A0F3PU16_ANAPH|nr:hypothetical protein APHCRT_1250 [Anaplasma phagocytophilum str. CRT53-1]